MGKIVRAVKSLPRKITGNVKKIKAKKIVNKVVQDANAEEIIFPDVENTAAVAVGDKATINNKPVTGEFMMPNGSVYVFSAGRLKEIIPPGEDAFARIDRTHGIKQYLSKARNKTNPTATADNRFAGIAERLYPNKHKSKQK